MSKRERESAKLEKILTEWRQALNDYDKIKKKINRSYIKKYERVIKTIENLIGNGE